MKNFKLPFTILLLSVFTAQSQVKPYVINQQLQLKTVPLGAASDSVMVVDATGLVKYVPKSSIGGGGGSRDLQQTLNNGGFAIFNEGNQLINIFDSTGGSDTFGVITREGGVSLTGIYLDPNGGNLTSSLDNGDIGRLEVYGGNIGLAIDRENSANTIVSFAEPIAPEGTGTILLEFPAKSESGTYTLATLDDITGGGGNLQQTLESGTDAEFDDANNTIKLLSDEGEGIRLTQIVMNNGTDTSHYYQKSNEVSLASENSVGNSGIMLSGNSLSLVSNTLEGESYKTNMLRLGEPTSVGLSQYFLPSKAPADYTLATLDDINLQQTLDNGNQATIDDSSITILGGVEGAKTFRFTLGDGSADYTQFDNYIGGLELVSKTGSDYGGLQTNSGIVSLIQTSDNGSTRLKFETPIDNSGEGSIIKVPAKIGEHTLATLDDITLQKTLENSGVATFNTNQQVISLFDGAGLGADTFYVHSKRTLDTSLSQFIVHPDYISLGQGISTESSNFGISYNKVLITQENSVGGSKKTLIKIADPIADNSDGHTGAVLNFPAKPEGDYILATIADLAVDNSTTTILSGTALSSAYPDAVNGFRVHCVSIVGGALTYEKTDTGWIQYTVTIVTP